MQGWKRAGGSAWPALLPSPRLSQADVQRGDCCACAFSLAPPAKHPPPTILDQSPARRPQNYGNQVEWMGEGYTTGITSSFYSFLLGLLLSQ